MSRKTVDIDHLINVVNAKTLKSIEAENDGVQITFATKEFRAGMQSLLEIIMIDNNDVYAGFQCLDGWEEDRTKRQYYLGKYKK